MPIDAVTQVPHPINEPVRQYLPGSPETAALAAEITRLRATTIDLPCVIGGVDRMASGERIDVVEPHAHRRVLGVTGNATAADAAAAVAAAKAAAPAWRALSYDDRAAVFLRAADMLAGPWRYTLNAATMLNQSKNLLLQLKQQMRPERKFSFSVADLIY